MSDVRIAFFGDAVGSLGRRAIAAAIPRLRSGRDVRLFIANGENSRNGSGISPDNYREMLRSGVHAVTLGDHAYKDRQIIPSLEDPHEPIARPANLAPDAPGKRHIILREPGLPPIIIITVLGRVFMPIIGDNPFLAVDRELAAIAATFPDAAHALAIIEIHGEVTSEKQAMAYHCLERHSTTAGPRVIAVVGSHTHVQTADARILDHTLAAITDVGMCGPHRSIIGRDINATLATMVRQAPSPLEVASDDNRACGVVVTIDLAGRRASAVEAFGIEIAD